MSALRVAVVSLLVAAAWPLEAGRGTAVSIRPLTSHDRGVVKRVKTRAAARLDEPECGRILTDFKDRSGRTLESNLRELGVSASQYLLDLSFLDGSALPACRTLAVVLAASPGLPRVFVCPAGPGWVNSRLSRMEFERGSLVEALVIHEMLHTLGLGENPPSTFEITARVRERCR